MRRRGEFQLQRSGRRTDPVMPLSRRPCRLANLHRALPLASRSRPQFQDWRKELYQREVCQLGGPSFERLSSERKSPSIDTSAARSVCHSRRGKHVDGLPGANRLLRQRASQAGRFGNGGPIRGRSSSSHARRNLHVDRHERQTRCSIVVTPTPAANRFARAHKVLDPRNHISWSAPRLPRFPCASGWPAMLVRPAALRASAW